VPGHLRELEIVVEALPQHPGAVPELLHGRAQALFPDHLSDFGGRVQLDALSFGKPLVESHALEPVHVVAVDVRNEEMLDVVQQKAATRGRAHLFQYAAIAVRTIHREPKAFARQEERSGVMILRERVSHAERDHFEADH
jgi:hypothetical protein